MIHAVPLPSAVAEVDYDPFAGGELERVVPTTEPQREVWLAAKLDTDASLAYNESVSLRLRGRLQIAALQRALVELVSLHDALRTTFSPDGDTFCVLETVAVPLLRTDLSQRVGDEQVAAMQARLRHSVETPFVLEQGPLLRTELLQLATEDHLLILSAHHIVCDGWSWWVIVRELGALYASACGHAVEPLPMPGSYTDFALAENQRAGSAAEREDETYWLSRFPDEAPALDLPTDRPRPGRRGFASAREDYVLDAELVTALRKLGARRGASLFATLLAGFGSVLSRITGQQDVVIGIPAAGQSVDGHDSLVGHCVNLLPLRFDLQPAMAFGSALDQSKEILLDAIEHQRYTFGTLLKKIRVPRDPSRLPLVSVLFNIDQALDQEREVFPGLALEFTTNPRSFENFELSINAVQCKGELRLECQYNRNLFETSTVRRWLSAYEALLRHAVHQVESPISRLALVDVAARMDLCALQPAPERFDREQLMHEGFERACDQHPARIAVVFENESWTYAQLEARANQIAHLLRLHGAGRGALVGLALDRGLDMLASLLGILKTGAGYVPLDPQFPADRIAYMAEDAGLTTLLTQSVHAPAFARGEVPVIALDAAGGMLDQQSDTRLARDHDSASPETTAYVIYTSGSTGKPKGVQVPHRAVSNFLAAMRKEPGMAAEDVLVAVTTLSFDIAVLELMLPLSVGAKIVLGSRDAVRDGAAFIALLSTSNATMLQGTPAMWRLLLEAGWSGHPRLKALCGGEPLAPALAAQILARCKELWNLYGPTETTIYSTGMRVLPGVAGSLPDIHIGRPVLNTRVWILDEQGELCPRGVPGEICIGGEGVALGYLHRPELTAEKFVPVDNAMALAGSGAHQSPTELLYRTGDRGRWRNDGNIEHLGRLDFQVKVRGYRIELGEIENTLVRHAGIDRAVAMAREDRPGDVRLVAYVVAAAAASSDSAAVMTHLRQSLPEYMVPQHLVWLDAIPLLPNGKMDRKRFPVPATAGLPAAPSTPAPADALVRAVMGAMESILGQASISPDDGFFELGGHSLLAAQLCSRLSRDLGVAVPLRLVFEAPSASRLAAALRESVESAQSRPSPRHDIPHRAGRSRAPMTLVQERMWVFEQMNPGGVSYNTPSAHRLHGPMDLQAFDRAFQEMLRRQASLRTCIVAEGETALQQVLEHLEFSLLPLQDLSSLPEPERSRTLMHELQAMTAEPFVLDRAPLFRARFYRMGEHDHVLYFMTHHIVWDGWSFDVFYSEMSALYQAFANGQASPLPELEVTYADFAAWQSEHAEELQLEHQVQHWTRHLEGTLEPLRLPQDHVRPAVASGSSGTEWVHIDLATASALREVGSRAGSTLFMTLLAAYYVLLHRLGGQQDLVVGLPFRNRPSEALEKVMGFFVNMLPLRMRIDPRTPFIDVLRQVRASVVEAFEFPDVPFDHLIRALKVPRDPSRSPLYQAVFSFQDVRQRQLQWGELRHEHLLLFQQGMSHDLGLWFLEHDEGLSGALGFNTDILSPESALAFGQRYRTLLESVCRNPEIPVGQAELLCESDRERLSQWNATCAPVPRFHTVDAMLQAQAGRTPDHVAIRCGEYALTYAQLQTRSATIAAALAQRGIGSGDRVGVCLDRHADLVAAMIAVWKVGAAYVPLDPAYPAERLCFMVGDARLPLVVSEGKLADAMGLAAQRLLLLDLDAEAIESAPALVTSTHGPAHADSAAYVIYTSGSTGQPKGVCVPHAAVVNFLAGMAGKPGFRSGEKLLAITTTSFDIAVLELFLPLSVGGEVVLAERASAVDGLALAALIEHHGIDVMQATPSTWLMLIESGWKGSPHLRALCGGEALSVDLAVRLLPRCGEVWNMYGPTETTVWSTCAQVFAGGHRGEKPDVHIGRPIANTTVWVLDDAGQRVPPGVAGEICISGSGVALGYLDRDELTASRFIEDPHPSGMVGVEAGQGRRLYRTGDLGRWRADGVLQHLGRLDFQVKVRGHRIELGEIESRLTADPSVARALVVAREDRADDVRLVAYVVAAAGAHVDPSGALSGLRKVLPAFMVPQHLLVLDAIPLLPNGKVDRARLPAPTAPEVLPNSSQAMSSQHSAGDSLTAQMVDVWSEMLGVEVGADDNFFDLGGHSLLAVKLFQRINRNTGVNLPLSKLLTASTPRALAQAYRKAGAADPEGSLASGTGGPDPWAPLVVLQEGARGLPLFLVHAVGGNVLNYRALAGKLPSSLTIYGLQALGLDGRTPPLKTVEAMAQRYVAEMRQVQAVGPYRIAGGSMGGIIAYEIAQQLAAQGERIAFLGLFDTSSGLSQGPQGAGARARLLADALKPQRLWNSVSSRSRTLLRRGRVGLARAIGAELPHDVRYAEVHRVHYLAACRYRVRPYDGDLVLFRAQDQAGRFPHSSTLGWSALVRDVAVIDIPGNHDDLVEAPELARELAAALVASDTTRLRESHGA